MQKAKLDILIIDDNNLFIERMTGMIRSIENISIINIANDYEEARFLLENESPDLVLLDINLPGKNGLEILRTIKESGYSCEVIMLSNHADAYYRQECKNLGAKYFLDKSNDFGMVPGIIRDFQLVKSA
ncbi:MAG TPA: response regulator [Chitinophagaceae bacterium]|nr:response regulator [Chitinophagaceae bacterium]